MGKTHLMQAAQLLAPPTPTTGGSKALKDNLPDADRLAKELDHYQKRLEVRHRHHHHFTATWHTRH
jgi:hypothetical protein